MASIVHDGRSSDKGDGLECAPPQPDTIPLFIVDAAMVPHARVVARIVRGEEVTQPERDDLPTSPDDWYGLACQAGKPPKFEKRRGAVERWFANHIKTRPDIVAAMRQALAEAERVPEVVDPPKPRRLKLISASELARTDFAPEWLVENILVARQPCLIGAAKKGMKTSMAIDLAVSLASGLPFLGEFVVPKPITTIVISGESGGAAIQSTSQRVCHAKGIRLDSLDGRYFVGFELPRLADEDDLRELGEMIANVGAGAVFIDPLYLCLASGQVNGRQIDMANLFQVGPLLLNVAKTCLDNGATPILIHHNKLTGGSADGKPELGDLAFAGIQEFARQWILLGRRERFQPGSGEHKLWLTAGGSIGHSGEWAVDVHEGVMDRDFSGRTWEVSVKTNGEAIGEEQAIKQAAKRSKAAENEIAHNATLRSHEDKVMEAIRRLGGQATRSKAYGGAGLNPGNGNAALTRLELAGLIEECSLVVSKGKGESTVSGVQIIEPRQTPTNPDNEP